MNCVEAIRFYINKILEPKGMKVVLMDQETVRFGDVLICVHVGEPLVRMPM